MLLCIVVGYSYRSYGKKIYHRKIVYHHNKEGKVFYGQEPPSGESTTTECGVNYQLLPVIY